MAMVHLGVSRVIQTEPEEPDDADRVRSDLYHLGRSDHDSTFTLTKC